MSLAKIPANCFNLAQIGWQHLNTNKKAMEQEFSLPAERPGWSGLFINLSIAFFIVIFTASVLSFINHSIAAEKIGQTTTNGLALSDNTN